MFENIRWVLDNLFGTRRDGFVIRENISTENIETCDGVAVTDDKTKTCALCVALNNTVFKDNNKPEYYHPNCKCKIKIIREEKKLLFIVYFLIFVVYYIRYQKLLYKWCYLDQCFGFFE